jgi:hypothetical protein
MVRTTSADRRHGYGDRRTLMREPKPRHPGDPGYDYAGELKRIFGLRNKKGSPALRRAVRVIEALYPAGPPDAATVRNSELLYVVQGWCNCQVPKLKCPSNETILRAAGRRK